MLHIFNIDAKARLSDVQKAITMNLVQYPSHYVLRADFSTKNSLLNSGLMNRHSFARMYKQVNENMDLRV